VIETIRQGLKEDGLVVSVSKLCRWFGVPRRTVYYRPTKKAPVVQERISHPIKQLIEESRVRLPDRGSPAGLQQEHRAACFSADAVAGEETICGLQAPRAGTAVGGRSSQRALGHGSLPGLDGPRWLGRARVGHGLLLLGWHLSRSGRSKTAEAALEQALIARYGTLGRVPRPFLLRSDNGLVFTSRSYTALVRSYGLRQEFITPHSPEQNGMVERLIRTLKEQCVYRHRFETLQHASRVIGDWIRFYNTRRPHQALGMKTPAEAYALAA